MSFISALILAMCFLPAMFACWVWFALTDRKTKPLKCDAIDK